jgi:arylsulfatase A-like enzyme
MPDDRPNILIIWGDDIGISNLSCYSDGLMGYRTPNIDRIAAEGVRFTDYYGEQSCTAGRAAFICGQNPYRTGLTKVGMPGGDLGLQDKDPTIATALKAHGYATGQFGKNHLGDKDEFLPIRHGFDEFFGPSTTSTPKRSPSSSTTRWEMRSSPTSSSSSGRVGSSTAGPTGGSWTRGR